MDELPEITTGSTINQEHAQIETQNVGKFYLTSDSDSPKVTYLDIEVKLENEKKIILSITSCINVQLTEDNYDIPFVRFKNYDRCLVAKNIFFKAPSGHGKSRAIFQIVKNRMQSYRKLFIINPRQTEYTNLRTIKLSELMSRESNIVTDQDALIWDSFPSKLSNRSIRQGQRALEEVTSGNAKNVFVALHPDYYEKYRNLSFDIPQEFESVDISYEQEQISEFLRSYGENNGRFNKIYVKYVARKLNQISEILWSKEPVPLTVMDYYADLKKFEDAKEYQIDPVAIAKNLVKPSDYYQKQFETMKQSANRRSEIEFLFTLKVLYDFALKGTPDIMRKFQKQIFHTEYSGNPLDKLSGWVYLAGSHYAMHDLVRNAIQMNDADELTVFNSLKEDNSIIPKNNKCSYLYGKYIGANIRFIDAPDIIQLFETLSLQFGILAKAFSSGFGQGIGENFLKLDERHRNEILHLISRDSSFASGLGESLGEKFTSIKDKNLQISILNDARSYKEFANGLVLNLGHIDTIKDIDLWNVLLEIAERNENVTDSLAFSIGVWLSSISDLEIIKKIFELARRNNAFADAFGDTMGQALAEIENEEVKYMIFKLAKDSESFASGFYPQLGTTLPDLDNSVKNKILKDVINDKKILLSLGTGIGSSLSSLESTYKNKFLELAEQDKDFAHDLGQGIGEKSNLLNINETLNLAPTNLGFAEGFGEGIGNSYSTAKNYFNVIEFVKTNAAFAGGFGSGLSDWINWNNQESPVELIDLISNMLVSDNFTRKISFGLGKVFYSIKDIRTRQVILEKATAEQSVGYNLFKGIGSVLSELDPAYQDEVFKLAEGNSKFAQGLGGGVEYFFSTLEDIYFMKRILIFSVNSPTFGNEFGYSLGKLFIESEFTSLRSVIEDILLKNKNRQYSFNIGQGLGREFDLIQDLELGNIIKIAGQNGDFAQGFAYMIGQSYGSIPNSNFKEQLIQLLNNSGGFAEGFGEGIGINLNSNTLAQIKSKELEWWKIAKQNHRFATGLGEGIGYSQGKVNTELRRLATEHLGQNNNFIFGLGFGLGWRISLTNLFDSDVWQEAKRNEEFARGLGKGLRRQFEYSERAEQERIIKLGRENKAFIEGLGKEN